MSRLVPLREFSRPHAPAQISRQTRVAGGVLTAIVYAAFILVAWWSFNQRPLALVRREITATLLPETPKKRVEPLPLLRLLKPKAEKLSAPVITIAPAPLTASAAATSPLVGGSAAGTGGNGGGGNGGTGAGCLDAVWMRAVSERVRQFYYYPPAALAVRKTGLVMVHFEVRRDGRIEKLAIGKSSGDAQLDKAALDIVQKAEPLPPIPDRMHAERVEGELPVNFGVRSFNGSSTTGTCG